MIYKNFAKVYDTVMKDMPYSEWIRYLEDLLIKFGPARKEILDVACGTGTMLIKLAKKGYNCTGIDFSEEMLKIARKKAGSASLKIKFIRQDMKNLKVKRKIPIVTCMYDSINYLLEKKEIKSFLRGVYSLLDNGGIFVFDMNTEYALKNIWDNKTTYSDIPKMTLISKSNYDAKKKTAYLRLTIFALINKNYEKISEIHKEKAYTLKDMRNMLKKEGFKHITAYKDRTFNSPDRKTGRVWFIAKKLQEVGYGRIRNKP
jgi:ubiquinone/menaquinone biosynthesis C-methylase UbiE